MNSMTWGAFKAWMQARGVDDADVIDYFDFSCCASEVDFHTDPRDDPPHSIRYVEVT